MNLPEGDRPVDTLDDDLQADEVDERLVAYLDGELEPEERRALEVQLGRSAVLRARLRSLQDGWEMLDELPMATPSPQLLESTLRMAATEAASQPRAIAAAPNRWGGWWQRLVASKIFWVSLLSAV